MKCLYFDDDDGQSEVLKHHVHDVWRTIRDAVQLSLPDLTISTFNDAGDAMEELRNHREEYGLLIVDLLAGRPDGILENAGAQLAHIAREPNGLRSPPPMAIIALSHAELSGQHAGRARREFEKAARQENAGPHDTHGCLYFSKSELKDTARPLSEFGAKLLEVMIDAGVLSDPVTVDDVLFDPTNPRIAGVTLPTGDTQEELLKLYWREYSARELALSIGTVGYWKYEPLIVVRDQSSTVLDGNRRLAALKGLRRADIRKQYAIDDLGLETEPPIPSPLYLKSRHAKALHQYVGFNHIKGALGWTAFAKATYMIKLCEIEGKSPEEIFLQLGGDFGELRRAHRAKRVLDQAVASGRFNLQNRYTLPNKLSFEAFLYGLDKPHIRAFLGLDGADRTSAAPVPQDRLDNLASLCRWVFGDKKEAVAPIVGTSEEHWEILDDILARPNAVSILNSSRTLAEADRSRHPDEDELLSSIIEIEDDLRRIYQKIQMSNFGKGRIQCRANSIADIANRIAGTQIDDVRE